MKNFFQRPKSANYEKDYLPKVIKVVNMTNLDTIKKQKVLSLYKSSQEKDFLAFRFDLLTQWMKNNKEYTKEYIVELDDMIDKLFLANELNSYEQQYLKNVQAIVFAKIRNLKQLIVDFSVNKNELVFYRYDLDAFKLVNDKGLIQLINKPDLYITTQRIIVSKDIDIISLYYDQIKNYHYSRGKLIIYLRNGNLCYVDSDINRAINESLNRVLVKGKILLK
ncbi:MAG: hypothetical protein ACOQNY_00045 [Mycoplasmoidaceae bacterium]